MSEDQKIILLCVIVLFIALYIIGVQQVALQWKEERIQTLERNESCDNKTQDAKASNTKQATTY